MRSTIRSDQYAQKCLVVLTAGPAPADRKAKACASRTACVSRKYIQDKLSYLPVMSSLQRVMKLFLNRYGQLDKKQVELAVSVLQNSGVIALPTDTLYGLTAKADDTRALERIYKIKGRDPNKPLAVCISSVDLITQVADIGKTNINVFRSLLPGPITVVLKRSEGLNKCLNPDIETIGVRLVDHVFITTVCEMVGPLALTSANRSGELSPVNVSDFRDLWDEVDLVFDAGELRRTLVGVSAFDSTRSGSTVVDLSDSTEKHYRIVRDGCALNRVVNTLNRLGYLRKFDPI